MHSILAGLLILLCIGVHGQSTVTIFDIEMNSNKIGELRATKNINGKKITKNISSNTKANVFSVSVHVESEVYVISENDLLLTSFAYRQVNRGSENIETTVKNTGQGRYRIVKNGEILTWDHGFITYSIVDLYFKEPKGLSVIFSNTHGVNLKIKHLGKNRYELELPDGKTNVFTYSAGKLISVEAKLMMGKILFKRKQ